MAIMQKERLRPLTIAEQRELRRIVKASSERVDRVKRATALLAVASRRSFSAAARAAGYRSPQAVTYLVRRLNRVGLAALGIAAGRGRRPTHAWRGRGLGGAGARPTMRWRGRGSWRRRSGHRTGRWTGRRPGR